MRGAAGLDAADCHTVPSVAQGPARRAALKARDMTMDTNEDDVHQAPKLALL